MSSSKSFKTYAVSLNFDKESSEKILSAVRDFAKITNPYLTEHSVPPHLTLGMFHAADEDSATLRSIFDDFAKSAGQSLLETDSSRVIEFGGTDNFKDKVIFLSVKKDSESFALLKKLNENLHEKVLPEFDAGANQNYLPKIFFPHIALAVKLKPPEFENAKELCARKIIIPDSAKIVSASLALCHPYEEIARIDFSLTSEQRHKNMAAIKSTGGKLETSLRRQIFSFGFRFRKNDRRLAGSPDIVFPHYRAVVFVNGCFWHAHGWKSESSLITSPLLDEKVLYSLKCEKFRMPASNPAFWNEKFTRNRARDIRDIEKLLSDGWRVGIVWECSITGKKRGDKIRSVAEKISLWLEEGFSELFREF